MILTIEMVWYHMVMPSWSVNDSNIAVFGRKSRANGKSWNGIFVCCRQAIAYRARRSATALKILLIYIVVTSWAIALLLFVSKPKVILLLEGLDWTYKSHSHYFTDVQVTKNTSNKYNTKVVTVSHYFLYVSRFPHFSVTARGFPRFSTIYNQWTVGKTKPLLFLHKHSNSTTSTHSLNHGTTETDQAQSGRLFAQE